MPYFPCLTSVLDSITTRKMIYHNTYHQFFLLADNCRRYKKCYFIFDIGCQKQPIPKIDFWYRLLIPAATKNKFQSSREDRMKFGDERAGASHPKKYPHQRTDPHQLSSTNQKPQNCYTWIVCFHLSHQQFYLSSLSLRVSRFVSLNPCICFSIVDFVSLDPCSICFPLRHEVARVATARAHLHCSLTPGGGRHDAPRHAAAARLASSSLRQASLCGGGGGPWWMTRLLLILREAPQLQPSRPQWSGVTSALA
jgi:hypothetical protein